MRRLTIASLALLGMVTPCLAQSPSQGPPDFGIDTSGTLRRLSVRDATLGSRVPLAILDTTTHSFAAPVILVEAYGAISGDAIDDLVAIQAAISAAPAGSCVSGSGKTYQIDGWLLLKNGTCLQDIKLVETGTGAQRPITSNCSGDHSGCVGPFTLRRVKIDRGTSTTDGSASDAAGIWLAYATSILMEDVEVTGNGAGVGIALPFSSNIKLVRPWIHDMEWASTTDLGIEQMAGLSCAQCSNLEIIDPRVENLFGTISWSASTSLAISQGKAWRTSGGKAYRAQTNGTTGTTAPACTSGSCSDGGVTWDYMGSAATTKRSYNADGIGISQSNGVSIRGGIIQHVWEGVDIGATNNAWLHGVTFMDIDSWGEKWCHSDTYSGSIGSRIFRAGIAGVVTCGWNPGEDPIAHHRIIDALAVDTGANGNWAGSHPGFWTNGANDIQLIDTIAVDTQAVPTMTSGYRSEGSSVSDSAGLINPYSLGHTGSARTGTFNFVLEGPYGTAVAASTGTSGHVLPFLDAAQNLWGTPSQQVFIHTSAGAATVPVALRNGGGTAGTEVAIDFSPTNNNPGVRSAQIASVASSASDANLVFRTSNGVVPSQAMSIGPYGSGKGGLMVGQSSVTDPGIGNIHVQGAVQFGVSTVAALAGACTAANEGMMRGVSDANSTTYNAVAAGGGANHMPVYCNGTNWVLH